MGRLRGAAGLEARAVDISRLAHQCCAGEVYAPLAGQIGRVKNDGGSFPQRDVATRQAYLWTGFFVFSAVFFLVVFLTGGLPLSKPVDLLSLSMCVFFALSWLSYATGGLGQNNRRTRGQ
jgi:hypothetical protein